MKIWLDDVRPIPEEFTDHVRNLKEFQELLASNSEVIEIMSFDHDLGEEEDGYQIIKWLAEYHLDRWPEKTFVHSANPPGASNIRAYDTFIRNKVLA